MVSAVTPTDPPPNVYCFGEEDEDGCAESSGEVPEVHDAPVPEEHQGAHAPARPGHDDEVVPGEELGAGDDDEDQPEGERESHEEAGDAVRHAGRAAADG